MSAKDTLLSALKFDESAFDAALKDKPELEAAVRQAMTGLSSLPALEALMTDHPELPWPAEFRSVIELSKVKTKADWDKWHSAHPRLGAALRQSLRQKWLEDSTARRSN